MTRDAAIWFVLIDGNETGPMSRAELGIEFATGGITGQSYVWRKGMSGWVPGAEVPELAALFASEAPPPPPDARPPPALKGAPSPRPAAAPRQRPAPKAAAGGKRAGAGASAAAKAEVGKGMSEFDTSHFRLSEMPEKSDPQQKKLEFDTSHFKLADLPGLEGKDWSKVSLQLDSRQFQPGVQGYPDAPGGAPRPLPAKAAAPEDGQPLLQPEVVRPVARPQLVAKVARSTAASRPAGGQSAQRGATLLLALLAGGAFFLLLMLWLVLK